MKSLYLLLCAITFAAQGVAHTVTFRRLNGTVLSRVEVEHGGSTAAPAAPAESGFTFSAWDGAANLANVTNDVTCWALYEAETAKSPSTSISSQSVAIRETPYSLDEYFQLYDNLAWSDEFSGTSLSAGAADLHLGNFHVGDSRNFPGKVDEKKTRKRRTAFKSRTAFKKGRKDD